MTTNTGRVYVSLMNQEQALGELPGIYAAALRLHAAGLDHAAIASRLEMPVQGVPSLLRVAAAKLATVMAEAPNGGEPA